MYNRFALYNERNKKPALFLDRDGVVNKKAPEGDYIKSVLELEVLEEIAESIKLATGLGYLIVIISNQRGVALGRMTSSDVDNIHTHINRWLISRGTKIDAFYVCPHDKNSCNCRKPKPGLILKAAQELYIDLSLSHMIGDSESDIGAALAAGIVSVHKSQTDSSILPLVRQLLKNN